MNAPTVVRLKDTRMRDGVLEGLVELSDGSEEWRPPSSVEVSIVNDRTGESVPVDDIKLRGEPCE